MRLFLPMKILNGVLLHSSSWFYIQWCHFWYLEISFGGHVYTLIIGKPYKSGIPLTSELSWNLYNAGTRASSYRRFKRESGKRMKNDREQRMDVMEIEEEEGHSHFFLAQDVFELEEEYLGTFPREPYSLHPLLWFAFFGYTSRVVRPERPRFLDLIITYANRCLGPFHTAESDQLHLQLICPSAAPSLTALQVISLDHSPNTGS